MESISRKIFMPMGARAFLPTIVSFILLSFFPVPLEDVFITLEPYKNISRITTLAISNPESKPVVSIVKIKNNNVDYAVRQAIDLLGGIRTVSTGKEQIMLKPNLVSPEPRDVTKIDVIKALARLMKESGTASAIVDMVRANKMGLVVIVAYHPMVASVMIYERFTAYGLKYSQPVAVWLILVCLALFLLLRIFSTPKNKAS
jgi:hypothetical protein